MRLTRRETEGRRGRRVGAVGFHVRRRRDGTGVGLVAVRLVEVDHLAAPAAVQATEVAGGLGETAARGGAAERDEVIARHRRDREVRVEAPCLLGERLNGPPEALRRLPEGGEYVVKWNDEG